MYMWSAVAVRAARMSARLARLRRDSSGNALVMFALTFVVLMLSVGATVDIGRWLLARDQTLAAVDAAVLAGGRTLQTSGDTAAAVTAAQQFYLMNVVSRIPVQSDSITFAASGQSVTAHGNAQIDTLFLQLANIETLPLISQATAEFAKAEFAFGGTGGVSDGNNTDTETNEISLMLDVTGSMKGQKLEDLKAAATDLIEIVLGDAGEQANTRVALVPFSEDIRLPTSTARDAARGTGLPSSKTLTSWSNSKTYYLSDCVVERIGDKKYSDAVPTSDQYALAHYTSQTSGYGANKKGECTIPVGSEITPLSSDEAALLEKISGLSASGGTAGHLGTAWTWYTLSPYWSSLWDVANQPAAYGTTNLKKIAILMTDGEYNTEYDANGVKVGSTAAGPAANGTSTVQARALCDAMKLEGIIIYTVGFDLSGPTSQSYQTLQQCASDTEKFYDAATGDQLQDAFRDIAIKLAAPLVLTK
jgi:Flp pilus assembly protein TadG